MYRNNLKTNQFNLYRPYLYRYPEANAIVEGSDEYSSIYGTVHFYQTPNGVLIGADISGLPNQHNGENLFLGFHIHEGNICGGNQGDAFALTGLHYNPSQNPHPHHAGDLPPLFVSDGFAFSVFLTNAFQLKEIIGRTIVIHSMADDFTSQPSGNAGMKIACGEIIKM